MNASLGRKAPTTGVVFSGRRYAAGEDYAFNELPPPARREVVEQEEEIESRFGHDPRALRYRFVVIPHEDLVQALRARFGERLDLAWSDPVVLSLARSLKRHGVKEPPVGESGWDRAVAAAVAGLDLPYFEVVEPFEIPGPVAIPTLDGSQGGELPEPAAKEMREGFWRMMQRIAAGIPGFVGTGEVTGSPGSYQFTGGNAGIRTAWPLRPHGTRLFETVPVAGFYSFGALWPQVLRAIGVFRGKRDNFSKAVERLEKEFGRAREFDLMRGTVPFPQRGEGPGLGSPQPPTRVKPWIRCGNTLFWRWMYAPEVDRPTVVHVNPIDLVKVSVVQEPVGLPAGAVVIVRTALPEGAPQGWSSSDLNQVLLSVPPLLGGPLAVWLGRAGDVEGAGGSRADLVRAFVVMAQPRKNAVLTGIEELLESANVPRTESRRLLVKEGSPAHAALAEAEAAVGVVEPSAVFREFELQDVLDETLSAYGVVEC